MTMPVQPVQTGPSDKEQAMVGLNHALLNAFHNLYLGKKKMAPAGLTNMMAVHQNPTGGQDIAESPVAPHNPLQMPGQQRLGNLAAIASRLMGRQV